MRQPSVPDLKQLVDSAKKLEEILEALSPNELVWLQQEVASSAGYSLSDGDDGGHEGYWYEQHEGTDNGWGYETAWEAIECDAEMLAWYIDSLKLRIGEIKSTLQAPCEPEPNT